jgi:hemolysin III
MPRSGTSLPTDDVDRDPQAGTASAAPTGEEQAEGKVRPTLRGIPDLIAAAVALPAGAYLVLCADGALAAFSATVFSLGLLAMLLTSGLYHAVTWSPSRLAWMSRLDHAAIFVLIGASYTPFCLCTDMPLGPHLLGVVWPCAAFGVLHCLFMEGAHRAVRAALYVLLGVAMAPSTPWLLGALPGPAFAAAVLGGAAYIVGALVYVRRWPNPSPKHFGYHEVFHLFVFAGAASHYVAIWQVVT